MRAEEAKCSLNTPNKKQGNEQKGFFCSIQRKLQGNERLIMLK